MLQTSDQSDTNRYILASQLDWCLTIRTRTQGACRMWIVQLKLRKTIVGYENHISQALDLSNDTRKLLQPEEVRMLIVELVVTTCSRWRPRFLSDRY
jgi:hypothetical protein